jgi:spore coat protein U-like protein
MNRVAAVAALLAACPLAQAAPYICTPTSNTISFGSYNPLTASPDLDGTGSFVIACTDSGGNKNKTTTINYTVTLSSQALRQLAPPSGTDRLNYNLYVDTTRSNPWGNGTGGTSTITGSIAVPGRSTASTAPISYYGRITAAQDVSANSPGPAPTTYSQSLTMTVTCIVSGTATTC